MITSCPCTASSRAPMGVSATLYSSALISVGTPTFNRSPHKLAGAQGEPQFDSISCPGQIAAGQLLDLANPVAKRVAMAVELPRCPLPVPVVLDERLERAQELAAVFAFVPPDRLQEPFGIKPERLVVLERKQESEGTEISMGSDVRAAPILKGRCL